jgi:hypothetical protein
MKKSAVLLMVIVFTLALVFITAACEGGASDNPNSGIKGTAMLGPLTPVTKQGETNDKPYAGAVIIIKNASCTETARTQTAQDGSFSAALPEGSYMVEGTNPEGAMLPYAAAFEVKVEKGAYTEITVSFDTGIR